MLSQEATGEGFYQNEEVSEERDDMGAKKQMNQHRREEKWIPKVMVVVPETEARGEQVS